MTWRRFVNRNGLGEGDYGNVPPQLAARLNLFRVRAGDMGADAASRLEAYERAYSMLLGDLRRLERDATDENAVCAEVARRAGIDAETVAAVLKEFIAF